MELEETKTANKSRTELQNEVERRQIAAKARAARRATADKLEATQKSMKKKTITQRKKEKLKKWISWSKRVARMTKT